MELMTLGDYPRIVAAGYDAQMIGERAIFFLYDYVKVGGLIRRRIVCEVTRPQFELIGEHQDFWRKLTGAPAPSDVRTVTLQ